MTLRRKNAGLWWRVAEYMVDADLERMTLAQVRERFPTYVGDKVPQIMRRGIKCGVLAVVGRAPTSTMSQPVYALTEYGRAQVAASREAARRVAPVTLARRPVQESFGHNPVGAHLQRFRFR